MNTPPIILSIAGSDPSGGAGIQADIKTISALGGYATTAITAITVQNTQGVRTVEYLTPVLVRQQTEAVLSDMKPAAIKIGITGTAGIVQAVATVLRHYPCRNIILDPVMVSTSGRTLTQPNAIEAVCHELFPLCCLVTPNLDEVSLLLDTPVRTVSEMKTAATTLYNRYGCAFLVKGGHLEGNDTTDVLYDGTLHVFTSPRIDTSNLHGTGCTLSSAIATLLGYGYTLSEAVRQAKRYTDNAIAAARDLHLGAGNGPLWHFPDTLNSKCL